MTVKIIRIMILLRLIRERDDAYPSSSTPRGRGHGPSRPLFKTSLSVLQLNAASTSAAQET